MPKLFPPPQHQLHTWPVQPFDCFRCNFIAQSICTTMYVHMRCMYIVAEPFEVCNVRRAQMYLNYIKSELCPVHVLNFNHCNKNSFET